jgi:hypothetical protein
MAIARRYERNCRVSLSFRLQDDAEIAVPVRLIRHERDASFDECKGFFVSPLLMRTPA